MDEREVRRLIGWNRLWLALLLVGAVAWGAQHMWIQERLETRALRMRWGEGGLKLYSASDGPFLVTHLVRLPGMDADKAVARLPDPLAIIDSGGAVVTREAYRKLVWRNYLGTPVAAPAEGSPLHALYTRPQYTPPTSKGD